MTAEDVAGQHYLDRRRLSDAVAELARRTWSRLNPANLDSSWQSLAPELLVGLAGAQLAAARAADGYTAEVLEENGPAAVNPAAFAGRASDGRPLDTLLLNPVTVVKAAVASGVSVAEAMAGGYANLDMLVRTQLADAGRAADQVALVAHPAAEGYTRMLVGKSCSRCLVLAGRWYAWNSGFRRHPRCDCIHVPGRRPSDGVQVDLRRSFESMIRTDQDKTFTISGAQAIRDGADINRVVNARRGMATAGETRTRVRADGLVVNESIRRQTTTRVGGRDVFTTTEATTRRGINRKVRLMPEEIYRIAGHDRAEALRLLRTNGYLTGKTPAPRRLAPAEVRSPAPRIPATPPGRIAPPTPTAGPAATKARDRLAAETARWNAAPDRAQQLAKESFKRQCDLLLAEIGELQGFSGLPRQVTRAEIDAAVAAGSPELWRGVVGSYINSAAEINGRLRTGAYEPGRGIYGNGWYFSERRITAENFREREPKTNYPAGGGSDFELSDLEGETPPDSLLRAVLAPSARIIDYDDLMRLVRRWEADQPEAAGARRVFADPGRFAAAQGYDGIRISGDRGDGGFYPGWEEADDPGGAVQYVVLNRTVMLIQRIEDVP